MELIISSFSKKKSVTVKTKSY